MKVTNRRLAIVCCLLLIMGSASRALAANRITSDVKITPQAPLTPEERKALSVAAAQLFHHVDKARLQIEHKDSKLALANIEQALTLARIMDNAVPERQVDTTIKSGNLTYHNVEKVKRLMVPVYRHEDEFIEASSPSKEVSKRTVGKHSTRGPLVSAGLEKKEMLLDVGETISRLNEAIAALKKNDRKSSIRALRRIDDAVELVTEQVDLPLERARMNLLEASRLAASNQFDQAEESLHRAVVVLEKYQSEAGGAIADKARNLTNSIKELSGKIKQDKTGAQQKLSDFAREVGSWL